jgi:hypothetical protein
MTLHRENPLIGDFPLQEEEATPEPISGYGIRIDPGDMLPTWLGRLVVAVPCQTDTSVTGRVAVHEISR